MAHSPAELSPAISAQANRWCWGLAFGVTLLWFALYAPWVGRGTCDEPGHFEVIQHFVEGRPGWPDLLPYPPGYHYAAIWLSFGAPTYLSARLVTFGFSLVMLASFGAAWRAYHHEPAGPGVLLLALLPILQPYTAMVYTDAPALALVCAAWWAHLTGRGWLAALFLAGACFIRQTSIIWGSFFLAREMLPAWSAAAGTVADKAKAALRAAWARGQGLILLHGLVAGVILYAGRLTPGTQHGNALQANPANLHFGAVLVFLLGLPLWLRAAPAAAVSLARAARAHPTRTGALLLAGLALVAGLAFTFRNPHVWNRDLWWPDATFTLLRNWPLVYADRWPALRWLASLLVVLMAVGLVRAALSRREGGELALVALFSGVLLGTNGLIEPRYFITPIVFWLFVSRRSHGPWLVLAAWWALLCAVHAPFVIRILSLW